MEMPTCKEKGEMGEHAEGEAMDGERYRQVSPNTDNKEEEEKKGSDGEERCRNDPARMQTHWSFQQLARCGLKICPQRRKQRPLNHSPPPIYTPQYGTTHTQGSPLTGAFEWLCFPEIGVHHYINENRLRHLQYNRRHLCTYAIDIMTTLRGN